MQREQAILVCFMGLSLWAGAQGTFLEKHLYSKWVSGEEELSFLQAAAKNSMYDGAEHPASFHFQGITYEPPADDGEWEAIRLLECCMCSYAALVQNGPDTLRLERGARGDFGPVSTTMHTFFIEGDGLVQVVVESEEDEPDVETRRRWQRSPDRSVPVIAPAHGQRHSNCWVPLNVREEPRLGSAVVGQLQWGDVVTVLQRAEEEVSVDLDFGSSFNAKSGRLELPVYTLRAPFVRVAFEGGEGYVFEGLLSERLPFDFASFFVAPASPTHPQPEGRFLRPYAALLWQERVDVEQRDEGMATKTFSVYSDGVVVKEWYDGKYQRGMTIEVPIDSPDAFYVASNNLLRFLSSLGFDDLSISPGSFFVNFSSMSESFNTELSWDGTTMYIHYGAGGC